MRGQTYNIWHRSTGRSEFQETDMLNSQLSNEQRFFSIKVFREAIRESNLKNGKVIRFKKKLLGEMHCGV